MKHQKEVKAQTSTTPSNLKKKEREQIALVRVEYIDTVLVRNTDPRQHKPSIREAIGWTISDPDEEYLILISEKPVNIQKYEKIHPEVAFVIHKTAILGIWDITTQNLRSKSPNH